MKEMCAQLMSRPSVRVAFLGCLILVSLMGCSYSPQRPNEGYVSEAMSPLQSPAAGVPIRGAEFAVAADMPALAVRRKGARSVPSIGDAVSSLEEGVGGRSDAMVVHSAEMDILVPSAAAARERIEEAVARLGGTVERATLDSIRFRVPPERFREALDAVGVLGEVLKRDIRSEDVTEDYVDMELRLDVAEASRQRLKKLLDRTGELKEVLEVERDIRRLTEEIETIKGKMRYLKDRVARSSVDVHLRERKPVVVSREHAWGNRFRWVGRTGISVAMRPVAHHAPLGGGFFLTRLLMRPLFALDTDGGGVVPKGFVPLTHTWSEIIATAPDEARLRVTHSQPRQVSDLEFWGDVLKTEVVMGRGYQALSDEPFPLDDKSLEARRTQFQVQFDGQAWLYDAWLVQEKANREGLVVVEYARLKKPGDKRLETIEKAVRGMTMRAGW